MSRSLNFKQLRIPAGIARKETITADVRETFADIIYTRANGIRAHRLAFKIYESTGEEVYSDEEVALIREVAERFCLPGFIDALSAQLKGE